LILVRPKWHQHTGMDTGIRGSAGTGIQVSRLSWYAHPYNFENKILC
jgi:hypothetical protein